MVNRRQRTQQQSEMVTHASAHPYREIYVSAYRHFLFVTEVSDSFYFVLIWFKPVFTTYKKFLRKRIVLFQTCFKPVQLVFF
jgi:hypothetical protein